MGNKADAAHDPEILRLENLDTDIAPPPIALDITRAGVDKDDNNSYLPFFGLDVLRQAATKRVSKVCNQEYDWRSECIITAGGMSGILNCFLAMIEPGDEVVVTDPVYAGIINRIRLAGGITKFVPLIPSPEGWRLDTDAFKKAVSSKTRMVVISPCMPTGIVFSEQEWEVITRVCVKEDVWLLYDAAMERLLYDNRTLIHPVSYPGMRERTIVVGAASKELRMIGWRVGWIVGPKEIMNDIGLVSISNVVCQTGITMGGVAAGLNADDDGLERALVIWQERRDVLMNELKGLPVVSPHGGWSFLINAEKLGMSASEFSEKLFTNGKIAATPMTGWGENAAKYVRFVFSNEPKERLVGIGNRLKIVQSN
jgi:aspartate/methionine/tyrosine aminotransferase